MKIIRRYVKHLNQGTSRIVNRVILVAQCSLFFIT